MVAATPRYVATTKFGAPSGGILYKYDPGGALIKTVPAPTGTFSFLTGIVFDPASGHLYVGGMGTVQTLFVQEYDTDLNLQATRSIELNLLPNQSSESAAIAVDGSGNVYAGGTVFAVTPAPARSLWAAKFTPHLAARVYLQRYIEDQRVKELFGIAADVAGNAYATGLMETPDGSEEGILVKLGPGGSQQFLRPYRSVGILPDDIFGSVAVDAEGNPYVLGDTCGDIVCSMAVLKFDPGGALRWIVDGSTVAVLNVAFPTLAGNAIAVDARKNVYATGLFLGAGLKTLALKLAQGAAPQFFLSISTGTNNQIGTVTKTLPLPLTVKVRDASGNPQNNIPISFALSSVPIGATGQALTVLSTATATDGTASSVLTLGNRVGTYTVTASCAQCAPGSVSFSAQAKLFLRAESDSAFISPVDFDQIVRAENRLGLTVTAFGVGGTSDVVTGYPVALVSAVAPNSGGHDHDTNRPDGSFSGAGLTVFTSSAAGMTDASGRMFAVFTSTYFSGMEIFTAKSSIDSNVIKVSTSIIVKTGDFVLLPDATNYMLRGGTCLHHGPQGPVGCTFPDHDHYGTSATTTAIAAVAAEWFQAHPELELAINDMSLPMGGGFDIGGNWSDNIVRKIFPPNRGCNLVGHCSHRSGVNVDILISPQTNPEDLSKPLRDELTRIIRNNGGSKYVEGTHWHVSF